MPLQRLGYLARRILPDSLITLLRKQRRRRAARLRQAARDEAIRAHGVFDAAELVSVLRQQGIGEGGVLLVQSSFNDLHTFAGKPADLLQALRTVVGTTGTLLMPAYTVDPDGPADQAHDPTRRPTYTGIVNELFRRTPGVLRSLHPRHSLCALGPLADELLARHAMQRYADGPGSPFDRMRQRDDTFIVTLGLPAGFTSFLHWVEDIEPERLPFKVHIDEPRRYLVRDQNGQTLEVLDMQVRPEIASRLDLAPVARALTSEAFRLLEHRGIPIGIYAMKPLSEQLVALRDQGIFHYH